MEWISVEKGLPSVKGGIFKVRLSDQNEIEAYFFSDCMAWISYYHRNHKLTHWQSKCDKKWIYNVTHWEKREENESML